MRAKSLSSKKAQKTKYKVTSSAEHKNLKLKRLPAAEIIYHLKDRKHPSKSIQTSYINPEKETTNPIVKITKAKAMKVLVL